MDDISKESSLSAAIESDTRFAPKSPQTVNWCNQLDSLLDGETVLNKHFLKLHFLSTL